MIALLRQDFHPKHGDGRWDTKLPDYRAIPSVREILVVSGRERRIEHWRREGGRWVVQDLIGEAELRLEVIDAPIPLAAVYENVTV